MLGLLVSFDVRLKQQNILYKFSGLNLHIQVLLFLSVSFQKKGVSDPVSLSPSLSPLKVAFQLNYMQILWFIFSPVNASNIYNYISLVYVSYAFPPLFLMELGYVV